MRLMSGETWLLESYLSAWLNGDRREGTASEFVATEMVIRNRQGVTVKRLKNVCGSWEVQAPKGPLRGGAQADRRSPSGASPNQHRAAR